MMQSGIAEASAAGGGGTYGRTDSPMCRAIGDHVRAVGAPSGASLTGSHSLGASLVGRSSVTVSAHA